MMNLFNIWVLNRTMFELIRCFFKKRLWSKSLFTYLHSCIGYRFLSAIMAVTKSCRAIKKKKINKPTRQKIII
ncbi:hypothetical protein CRP01_40530 [Flavilitoribacter nigricans DSM 23189 = NBRC 102662]|uniref:Uncharacterized protein n=1 Tax=Flavilitoribacter nigricans (strain ATCC 23147 / DSM 23189 / NBRC 102662 / NCIMB 1420 / SS-2) TaxID=1122177 RepID=A0A2D0MXX8_FLAN2|nr:hypothetical protein CRP01_40530 [Flavilitoribacter nigricans DSM 23189 = NBRC 102662]